MFGRDLTARLEARHQVIGADLPEVDITDARLVQQAFAGTKFDAVIHTAAFTAVDDCERQPDLAFKVNAEGTRNIAVACREPPFPCFLSAQTTSSTGGNQLPTRKTICPVP